jgi:pseudaminic acid synthase
LESGKKYYPYFSESGRGMSSLDVHTFENLGIGPEFQPFIIAELSGNHNGELARALKLIDAAAEAGVNAVKLQTYTADTITMPGVYRIEDPNSLWHGRDLYELYQEAFTPWAWHEALYRHAESLGIICFSSPFDETAVDFLESLGSKLYKIASFENTHFPLIRKVLKTGKPLILSSGVIQWEELDETMAFIREEGGQEVALLKCTSNYPADPIDSNLLAIPRLAERYGTITGLSDHTLGIGVAIASVALGACIIEKHITLDRSEGGVDAAFSLEPDEFAAMVKETHDAHRALGVPELVTRPGQLASSVFKRSIYAARHITAGEELNADNLRVIRPALGIPAKAFDQVAGKFAVKDIPKGTPLNYNHFQNE